MQSDESLRRFLCEHALSLADSRSDVLSVTITGSFSEGAGMNNIGDIDVIVVTAILHETNYRAILGHFEHAGGELKKNFNLNLRINPTFGPVKYNLSGTVVYHVMIYSLAGHIVHVRKSPFTCLDWEESRVYRKNTLRSLYPAPQLSPNDFFNARRGIHEYLSDYEQGIISYREYIFEDRRPQEVLRTKPMENKDRWEFVYHILRFTALNFVRFADRTPHARDPETVFQRLRQFLPEISDEYFHVLCRIKKYKLINDFPGADQRLDETVRGYLAAFQTGFFRMFPVSAPRVHFFRHEKTDLNKNNVFLGNRLDPHICTKPKPLDENIRNKIRRVYASPAQRSIETAQCLLPDTPAEIHHDLSEIDYGDAEGNDINWLKTNHPEIVRDWQKGTDAAFPNGENHEMVLKRCRQFIAYLNKNTGQEKNGDAGDGDILAVTHNVWLRVLIGSLMRIEPQYWYLLRIPYAKKLSFIQGGPTGLYVDVPAELLRNICKDADRERLCSTLKSFYPSVRNDYIFWHEVFFPSDNSHTVHPSCSNSFVMSASEKKKNVLKQTPRVRMHNGTCLIPMAGLGVRFREEGFITPKPLIRILDKPMILETISCLPVFPRTVLCIRESCTGSDAGTYTGFLKKSCSGEIQIVNIQNPTEGQASTCLRGIPYAAANEPLFIAPCDNGMIWRQDKFSALLDNEKPDIVCWTFTRHMVIPQSPASWGYVKISAEGRVQEVSVKRPFTEDPYSEHCIIGAFWFRTADLFTKLAEDLIGSDLRVNGEFYVDSIIGLAAQKGYDVMIFDVDKYISWGKPQDVYEYRNWLEIHSLFGTRAGEHTYADSDSQS